MGDLGIFGGFWIGRMRMGEVVLDVCEEVMGEGRLLRGGGWVDWGFFFCLDVEAYILCGQGVNANYTFDAIHDVSFS